MYVQKCIFLITFIVTQFLYLEYKMCIIDRKINYSKIYSKRRKETRQKGVKKCTNIITLKGKLKF